MPIQKRHIYAEQVRILYRQTLTASLGGAVAGGVLAWMLKDEAEPTRLMAWLLTLFTAQLLIRVPSYFLFRKRQPGDQDIGPWGALYLTMTVLHGLIWGATPWLFITPEQPESLFIILLWAIGMSAASISAYAAYVRAMMAFTLPVLLPTILYLLVTPGQYNLALAVGAIIYVVVVFRAAAPINTAIVDSIRLNQELASEIEVRKDIEKQLKVMARQDGLTGLANRRRFDEVLASELARAERENYPLTLIMLDIDYFKAFNDSYGHQAGDNCLRRVSAALQATLKRAADLPARYGGEEFAVILPHTNPEQGLRVAEKIRAAVQALAIPNAGARIPGIGSVTVSAGVATFAGEQRGIAEAIISLADSRLYQAKNEGRNKVVAASVV